MSSAARQRLAADLQRALRREYAERVSVQIDRGFGLQAVAAISARPPGIARRVEAQRWARRAAQAGDDVVTVITGGMSDDELDALVELHVALAEEREAA